MKRLAIVAVLAVAGCVDQGPPPPSPALQKVMAACEAGNETACITVAEVEERQRSERAARQAAVPMPTYQVYQMDPEPFMNRPAPTVTVRTNQCLDGRVVLWPQSCL